MIGIYCTFVWADDDAVRKNFFNDPFFQISSSIQDCPMPVGPFMTAEQKLAAAHHRAERGTTCWLEGKCDRPSSYDYDQDIAGSFKGQLGTIKQSLVFTTLWVTVQGRVVYIEGCVQNQKFGRELEAFAMALPFVQIAVAKVWSGETTEPRRMEFW